MHSPDTHTFTRDDPIIHKSKLTAQKFKTELAGLETIVMQTHPFPREKRKMVQYLVILNRLKWVGNERVYHNYEEAGCMYG